MACYSGSNPVKTIDEGMEIWKWAKKYGIDRGLPFDQIHDLINHEYFGGTAKPQWITEILAGRKTPLRQVATEAWRAQANRRIIIEQAERKTGRAAMSPAGRAISAILEGPRFVAVGAHAYAFPFTHSGEMIFQPRRWGLFYQNLINTYKHAHSKVETEQIMNDMYKDDMFNSAINLGVDLSPRAHGGELINLGGQSERAWDMIKVLRFGVFKQEYTKFLAKHPEMPVEEKTEMGRYLATMANHATGSGQGFLTGSKGAGNVLFGAKLTQSKLNRMGEAVKTLKTFGNWGNATPVQRAAAKTHFTQMATFGLTYAGFLTANQGLLWAARQKDKDGKPTQINWQDPTKSDWMAFKLGGLEAKVPGIRSELKVLGQLLAIAFKDSKEVKKETHGGTKFGLALKELGEYAVSKASPLTGMTAEGLYGTETWGLHRPMPWSDEPGTSKSPRMDWWQYAISHGPIPLSGPIRYLYDQAKEQGMSALDAMTWIKALIIGGVGFSGLHVVPDYNAAKEAAKQAAVAKALQAR